MKLEDMLNGTLRRSSHVFRYSSLPTHNKESVAEHTFYVAAYSMFLAEAINMRFGVSIDLRKLMYGSLLHDLDETLTGDIIQPFKYSSPEIKSAIDMQAERSMKILLNGLGMQHLYDEWMFAKDGTLEGSIVVLADHASVVSYCLEERKLGNGYANEPLKNVMLILRRNIDSGVYHIYVTPYAHELYELVRSYVSIGV